MSEDATRSKFVVRDRVSGALIGLLIADGMARASGELAAFSWGAEGNAALTMIDSLADDRQHSLGEGHALVHALVRTLWRRGAEAELMAIAVAEPASAYEQAICVWVASLTHTLLQGDANPLLPALESSDAVEFQAILMAARDFASAVRTVVDRGVTAEWVALMGGLAGVRFGHYSIPRDWRARLGEASLWQTTHRRLLNRYRNEDAHGGTEIRTSITHPLRIGTVTLSGSKGRIGVTFCPGKKQNAAITGIWDRDLDVDLDAIASWGARHLLTLIETCELEALCVMRLPDAARTRGIAWHHAPIVDGEIPDAAFDKRWEEVGGALLRALERGESVVVHCKGGLGRAGTIAARFLVEIGECSSGDKAMQRVREVRANAIETAGQERYVRGLTLVDSVGPSLRSKGPSPR